MIHFQMILFILFLFWEWTIRVLVEPITLHGGFPFLFNSLCYHWVTEIICYFPALILFDDIDQMMPSASNSRVVFYMSRHEMVKWCNSAMVKSYNGKMVK